MRGKWGERAVSGTWAMSVRVSEGVVGVGESDCEGERQGACMCLACHCIPHNHTCLRAPIAGVTCRTSPRATATRSAGRRTGSCGGQCGEGTGSTGLGRRGQRGGESNNSFLLSSISPARSALFLASLSLPPPKPALPLVHSPPAASTTSLTHSHHRTTTPPPPPPQPALPPPSDAGGPGRPQRRHCAPGPGHEGADRAAQVGREPRDDGEEGAGAQAVVQARGGGDGCLSLS